MRKGTSYVAYGKEERVRVYKAKSVDDACKFAANLRFVLGGIDAPWTYDTVRWTGNGYTIFVTREYTEV